MNSDLKKKKKREKEEEKKKIEKKKITLVFKLFQLSL